MITEPESKQLNEFLSDAADDLEYDFFGGKAIPYIGWYWREVDFTSRIRLGYAPSMGVGFMENNKWGYDEFTITEDETNEIIRRLLKIQETKSIDECKILAGYMQTLKYHLEEKNASQ